MEKVSISYSQRVSGIAIERLHLKLCMQKLLDNHVTVRPYLGAISMGVIGVNVTLVVLRAPHSEHHSQTLGQDWEQTYKLD